MESIMDFLNTISWNFHSTVAKSMQNGIQEEVVFYKDGTMAMALQIIQREDLECKALVMLCKMYIIVHRLAWKIGTTSFLLLISSPN